MQARKNISDNIYEVIKQDLLTGILKFGDSISEIEYSEKLNVSRTPLREAIKKLEIEGIIDRLPNGRLRVMEITQGRIREIFQIRIALENIILESILREKKNLHSLLTSLEENLTLTKLYINTENWGEARKLFSEFNKLLYKASNLEFTVKIITQYDFVISKLRSDSLQNIERIKEAHLEHIELLDTLKKGDLEKVKVLNEAHLLKSKRSILDFFNKKEGAKTPSEI